MEQSQNNDEQPSRPNDPIIPAASITQSLSMPLRTATSTPISSPGLFGPTPSRTLFQVTSISESNTPAPLIGGPFLHPLQQHKVRETHKALIDNDNVTGRKVINQYEVIEEIGRGMHGKVKLARNLETGDNVAIKIIPRFSKKRRLGKVMAMSPEQKTKQEIAILKKIRHPNVVALLEIIDDPELEKIYIVLEHVELGEVVWRKKGLPHVCIYERRRAEREMRGEPPSQQEIQYDEMLQRRQAIKELKRTRMAQNYNGPANYWSVEHGAADEASSVAWSRISSTTQDFDSTSSHPSRSASPTSFLHYNSRRPSAASLSAAAGPIELSQDVDWEDNMTTPGPLTADLDPVAAAAAAAAALDGLDEDATRFRPRSPSMADSIISHMSSIDYNPHVHDPFTDDYSYVPCFTFDQARSAFRDTLLGLEYLHYQGVVHRDIKPANLLWSKDHRVKISDFGVSYFGRPIRDGEPDEPVSESEAKDFDNDLELAKTVGTPAFFAPELCYTDPDKEQPKVSEQIDVWSLGVTLYCLIFARIPFLAEDEFRMFRKIATEDVYIPRRRLAPVDPSTSPSATSLYKRHNNRPYRDDNDVVYEDVDNLLFDLLRQMLTKDPERRIRLRDVKRHPWVLLGLPNPLAWADETDPARPFGGGGGRKIQVDEKDMSSAVVPLTFLERARSVVKKAVGKVIHPLAERSDNRPRKRADSSAASSTGDNSHHRSMPTTPHYLVDKRLLFMPDDFLSSRQNAPSADHSVTVTAVHSDVGTGSRSPFLPVSDTNRFAAAASSETRSHESSPAPLTRRACHRATASQSKLSTHFLNLAPVLTEPAHVQSFSADLPPSRGISLLSRDVDAAGLNRKQKGPAVFNSLDKRLVAQAGCLARPTTSTHNSLTGAVCGNLKKRSTDQVRVSAGIYNSPPSSSPGTYPAYRNAHPKSEPDFQAHRALKLATQVDSMDDLASQADSTRAMASSPAESFITRHINTLSQSIDSRNKKPRPISLPSTDLNDGQRRNTEVTVKSVSTDSMEALATPLTSPSETMSPVMTAPTSKSTSNKIVSDPFLPALLSNVSSVSADMEGELLGKPGVVSTHASLPRDDDDDNDAQLNPGFLRKVDHVHASEQTVFGNGSAMESGTLTVQLDTSVVQDPVGSVNGNCSRLTDDTAENEEDDDGSDDGFLLMTKPRRRKPCSSLPPVPRPFEAKRRDTNLSNTSIASDETAKHVVLQPEDDFGQASA